MARLAFVDRWEAELRAIDDATLDAGERIDRDLILGELDHARFNDEVLREETWNPLAWVYLLGGGIHPLLAARVRAARTSGWRPWPGGSRAMPGGHRRRARGRWARTRIAPSPASWPRPPRSGSAASTSSPRRRSQAGEAAAAAGDADVAALLPRLRAAAATASAALDAFRRHLADERRAARDRAARSSACRCSRPSCATPCATRT